MSGAEVITVLGVISSIIAIVDGTKKVYDAATNAQGLPEAFREVAGRLPIVGNILDSTKQDIKERKVNNDSYIGVKHIVESCEEKAKKLEVLFHKAIPADDASDLKLYYKAVKLWGRGSEVETLMKGMLEDVQLLACERGMKTATKAQQEQIIKAIKEVSDVSPSVPEHEFQETGFTNTNYGPGTQYNARGEYVAQGNAQQYNSGGGSMTFVGPNEDIEQACLSALRLTDPRDDRAKLITAKGRRVDGTCKWIKNHDHYKSWLGSKTRLLWLHGGPGKGKTMLSIFLAEELERTVSQKQLFLQYFCDNKDETRNTAVAVIRGLVFQLLQSRPKLFRHILPDFKILGELLFQRRSFETLWRIFEEMIRDPTLEITYCVLDGLDECEEASLNVLLAKFASLFSANTDESSACHLNLLIVSRNYPDIISEVLSGFPRIALDPDTNIETNKDIDLFIKARVQDLSERKFYRKALRIYVENVFRDRAEGTFLWIGTVAQELERYKATEVVEKLNDFPPGIDNVYARILLQIESGRREIAARILRWVVMAVRPLTIPELSIALETSVQTPPVDSTRDEVIRDQVLYCGHILVIKGDEVSLIHQSAKDYFLRETPDSDDVLELFRVEEKVANLEIVSTCLDYLQSGALENSEPNLLSNTDHLETFPLLSYAVLHWHEHASSLAPSEDNFDLSRPFYHDKSRIRTSWLKAYWESEMCGPPPELFTLLMLASYFGILPLAKKLVLGRNWIKKMLPSSFSLDTSDGKGMTALIWAAAGGHESIVGLLLDNGADIEGNDRWGQAVIAAAENGHGAIVRLLWNKGKNQKAKDKYAAIALIEAAELGHEAVVRLLLENGVNIETRDKTNTVLIVAAGSGHEAVARLLLERGADIEAKNHRKATALIMAAELGHEAVVRLLLEREADIEAYDYYQTTALITAADSGHEVVAQLLLERGANIEAKNRHKATALITAADSGHEVVIRLLLERGANIEAHNKYQATALIMAANSGHEAVVRLLLERGANIEAHNEYQTTALVMAANPGHEAVVRLLLEREADIEAKNHHKATALIIAADSGHEAVVRLLLERGADIEAHDEYQATALTRAVENMHEDIIRLLLEKGADIEVIDHTEWTVLMLTAANGHEAAMRLLLERGADIEANDEYQATALTKAVENMHEDMIRLLLEKGADIEVIDHTGRTVLMLAAANGHEAAMRLLLENGADIHVKDKDGETAMMKAAECRYEGRNEAVRLLLEKGADIKAHDNYWETALTKAVMSNHQDVIRLLTSDGNS